MMRFSTLLKKPAEWMRSAGVRVHDEGGHWGARGAVRCGDVDELFDHLRSLAEQP